VLTEDWVRGLSDTEVAAGWIGDNHAERDAVRRILWEGNEERGLEAGSVVIVKQLESFKNPLSNH
jgi:hypothetical protein